MRAEGTAVKKAARKQLLGAARRLSGDGATYETWLSHIRGRMWPMVDTVGEAELEHIWVVAQNDRHFDDEDR